MIVRKWRGCLLALAACFVMASCAGTAYQPVRNDQNGPIHGESGGAGGGGAGGSM